MKAKKGNGGRPSKYSAELADRICERLAEGEALYRICGGDGMPTERTVITWKQTKPEFLQKYARAKMEMLEREAENLITLSDSIDDPQRLRIRVDTRKWLLSKLIPKKYGDKLELEQSGQLDIVVQIGGETIAKGNTQT
jgi:flagellar motor switch/type III secretory pathway protein FliN